jgi:hypothetical protein
MPQPKAAGQATACDYGRLNSAGFLLSSLTEGKTPWFLRYSVTVDMSTPIAPVCALTADSRGRRGVRLERGRCVDPDVFADVVADVLDAMRQ